MGLIAPTLPTAGQDRGSEEIDVLNTLTAAVNVINGNLDANNLDAAAGVLLTQLESNARPAAIRSDWSAHRIADATALSGFSAESVFHKWFHDATNDLVIPTLTPNFRLRVSLFANAVSANASFTIHLKEITAVAGAAGAITYTLGASLASVTFTSTNSGGNSVRSNQTSSTLTSLATGYYALTWLPSGATSANSRVDVTAEIQKKYV